MLDAAHSRAPDLTLTFAGEEGPDAFGLPGTAPFDAGDVPEGGGMHGGLHRRELATLLAMHGGLFRRGALVQGAADLSDIAPTLLHLLGLDTAEMEGRVLTAAWDASTDAPPEEENLLLPRGFVLERMRQDGRLYPTALCRAA
jgi:phosphonoacetate hydrolase